MTTSPTLAGPGALLSACAQRDAASTLISVPVQINDCNCMGNSCTPARVTRWLMCPVTWRQEDGCGAASPTPAASQGLKRARPVSGLTSSRWNDQRRRLPMPTPGIFFPVWRAVAQLTSRISLTVAGAAPEWCAALRLRTSPASRAPDNERHCMDEPGGCQPRECKARPGRLLLLGGNEGA